MAVAALRLLAHRSRPVGHGALLLPIAGIPPAAMASPGRGVYASWRTELTLLVPVVAAALRRASTLATSLTARGYDAGQRRTIFPALAMTGPERIAIVALIVSGADLAGIKSLYWLALAGFIRGTGSAAWFSFARDWL